MDVYQKKQESGILEFIKSLLIILPIAFLIRTFGFGLYQVPSGSMETTMLVGERFFADKFTPLFTPTRRGTVLSFNDPNFRYSKNAFWRLFEQYVWGPVNVTKRVVGLPGEHVRGVIEDGKPVIYINDKKFDEPYLNKYPLIAVPSDEALAARSHYDVNSYLYAFERAHPRQSPIMHRSYDASFAYEQQPFYRMSEQGAKLGLKIIEDWNVRAQAQGLMERGIKHPGTLLCPVKQTSYDGPRQRYYNRSDVFNVKLGDNEYWVMGDNRLGSADSRCFGPLDGSLIHGRIIFRILSIDTYDSWLLLDILKHPIEFWSRVRWNRFFQVIR